MRPTKKRIQEYVSKMIGSDADLKVGESFLNTMLELKNDYTNFQPNTGYDLLIINKPSSPDSRIALVDPHPLPVELQIEKDGIENSRKALHRAIEGLITCMLEPTPAFAILKKRLPLFKA